MDPKLSPAPRDVINWSAAFANYLKGYSLRDIAETFDVTLAAVQHRAAEERWGELLAEVKSLPDAIDKAKKDSKRLDTNREKNYAVFDMLREDLVEMATRLRAGQLKFKRKKVTRAGIVDVEEEADLRDRVHLAQAARIVSEGTYRSLGDVTALGSDEKSRRGGDAPQSITILLPGAICGGAEKLADAEVIDLRPRNEED